MKYLLAVALLAAGCTSAEMSKVKSLGKNHRVTLFSASGGVIGQWDTDGITHNEEDSDGLYFTDAQSHTLVRIAGTFIDVQN